MKETVIIRCDRCHLFREVGEYTKFEVREAIIKRKKTDEDGNVYFETEQIDYGEKRGLCVDCAPYVAKRLYDIEHFKS